MLSPPTMFFKCKLFLKRPMAGRVSPKLQLCTWLLLSFCHFKLFTPGLGWKGGGPLL